MEVRKPEYIVSKPAPDAPSLADMEILAKLSRLVRADLQEYYPQEHTYGISSSQPWIVDYMGRKRLYMFSSTALTLSVEDLGTYTINAGVWNEVAFPQGYRCYAQGQNTLVYVFIRATDITLATGSSGSASSSNELLIPYGNIIPGLTSTETWNSVQKFGSLDNIFPNSFTLPADPVGLTSFSSNPAPTGLQPNSGILFQGSFGSTDEIAFTTSNYVAGSNPITVTAPIQHPNHTSIRFNPLDPMGPKRGAFLGFGLPPVALALYNNTGNGGYQLAQGDQSGRVIVAPQDPTWTILTLQTFPGQTTNGFHQLASIQGYTQFLFFLTISAIAGGGSITFTLNNQDFNVNTVTTPFYTSAALTSTQEIEIQVGVGLQVPHVFFQTGLISWAITPGTTVTFTLEIEAR